MMISNDNTTKDLSVLKYTKSAQKKYMILVDFAVLVISFLNGYVNAIRSLIGVKEASFSFESLIINIKDFYIKVNDPFSYIVDILTFLLTMSIALAVIVTEREREKMLSKLSYWLCVGSGACMMLLIPSLLHVLGVVKALFIFIVYNIIIYYLGRISLIVGKETMILSQRNIDEKALLVYSDLYRRYYDHDALGTGKSIDAILIASCVLILSWVAVVIAVIAISFSCPDVIRLNIYIFIFSYVFGLIALVKNEERGRNRCLLIFSVGLPLILVSVTLLFLLYRRQCLFIVFAVFAIMCIWILICSILSGLSIYRYKTIVNKSIILSYALSPVVFVYRIKQKYYKKNISNINKRLEKSNNYERSGVTL